MELFTKHCCKLTVDNIRDVDYVPDSINAFGMKSMSRATATLISIPRTQHTLVRAENAAARYRAEHKAAAVF